MTKYDIRVALEEVEAILNMDYHDFLKFYNDNIYPIANMDTDFYTVFTSQRKICNYRIHRVLCGLPNSPTTNRGY